MPTIALLINSKTGYVKEIGEVHYHTMEEADAVLTEQCLDHQHQLKQIPDLRVVFCTKSSMGVMKHWCLLTLILLEKWKRQI